MRTRKGLFLGLAIALIGIVVGPTNLGLRLEEEVGLRSLFKLRGPVSPPRDVVIVSIDKAAAQQLGMDPARWPPPRSVHASVVRRLNRHAVSAVVMDVWFEGVGSAEDDAELARAMAENGKVVLVQRVDRGRVPGAGVNTEVLQSPIQELQKSAISLAPFPLPRQPTTSFFWPFFETSTGVVPTLPAAALQIHGLPVLGQFLSLLQESGVTSVSALPSSVTSAAESGRLMTGLRREVRNNPLAASRLREHFETDAAVSQAQRRDLTALLRLYTEGDIAYLNFYGPAGTIETIPFHELLQDDGRQRPDLAGKVVFVGEGVSSLMTSALQVDTYPTVYSTPEGVDLSGAEIAATAFANLLTSRTLQPIRPWTALLTLLIFGGIVGFVMRMLPAIRGPMAAVAIGAAGVGLAYQLFAVHSVLVPLAVPVLVQLPLAVVTGLFLRYRDIRKQVPLELDPQEKQQLFRGVCLATDVKGYTTLAERLKPEELHQLLDEYYDMLRVLVRTRGGLVWGRGGDSMLSVWKLSTRGSRLAAMLPIGRGRAVSVEKSGRLNACLAALEIRDAVERFNAQHPAAALATRIGLDVGDVGMGPVGGELQVVGNPVNTASRIEGLNKHLSTRVLASASVIRDLESLLVRPLGFFALRGKSDTTEIVEILGHGDGFEDSRLSERFAAALRQFDEGNWSAAAGSFEQLTRDYPDDGPSRYYRDVAVRYLEERAPRPDGHAVIKLDTR